MVDLTRIDELVAEAIPGEAAAGINARYEEPYEQLSEEMGKLESLSDDMPDWTRVADLAGTVLVDLSKDMMAAAWLAGGLWETEKYAGLRRGLSCVRTILRDYWEDGFPSRLRARRSAVNWICERALNWIDAGTPAPSREDLEDLVAIVGDMYSSTEDKWDGEDPPIWQLQKRYQTALDAMPAPASDAVVADEMPSPSAAGAGMPAPVMGMPAPAMAGGVPQAQTSGMITSRADAYNTLRQIAAFIEQTEPHSPVVPLLRRAVSWSDMSFEEIYTSLLKRFSGSMAYVWDTLGLDLEDVPGGEASLQVSNDGGASPAAASPAPTPAAMPTPAAASPAPAPADDGGMPSPTIL